MGGERVTVKNLLVVKVDEEKNLIYLRGAVPGAPNAYVAIKRAKRGRREEAMKIAVELREQDGAESTSPRTSPSHRSTDPHRRQASVA
jgi:large subunit ribosomal protein L3